MTTLEFIKELMYNNNEKLKALLAYRISQDDPMRPKEPSFDKEWGKIFTKHKINH